jgi:hypothetical protein
MASASSSSTLDNAPLTSDPKHPSLNLDPDLAEKGHGFGAAAMNSEHQDHQ